MVALDSERGDPGSPTLVPVPLSIAGSGPRRVPLDHAVVVAARDLGITLGEPEAEQQ
jgi:hypothetical protein